MNELALKLMPDNLEVQFGRLDERLKGLEKKQDEHHQTVLTEIKDLREGVVARLERVEITKLLADDFIRFKKDEFAPLIDDVKALMQYRWILGGIVTLAMFLAPFVWSIINKRL